MAGCRELGIAQSVGRTGVCFDNVMTESFWSTLKTEFYDRKKWATRDEGRKAVARWIEIVCNRRRRRSAIGMVSLVDFESRISAQIDKKKASAQLRVHNLRATPPCFGLGRAINRRAVM